MASGLSLNELLRLAELSLRDNKSDVERSMTIARQVWDRLRKEEQNFDAHKLSGQALDAIWGGVDACRNDECDHPVVADCINSWHAMMMGLPESEPVPIKEPRKLGSIVLAHTSADSTIRQYIRYTEITTAKHPWMKANHAGTPLLYSWDDLKSPRLLREDES